MNKKIFLLLGILSILVACGGDSSGGNGDSDYIQNRDLTPNSSNITAVSTFKPDNGRLLASNCFGCHGTNGVSVTKWDSIAGEDELREEMFESDGIMLVHAKGYSNSEILTMENFLKGLSKAEGREYESDNDDKRHESSDRDDDDDDDDEKHERKRKHKEHDDEDDD